MKRIVALLFFIVCLFPVRMFAQSGQPLPKTLLWRISGNGLSKNSFLYGTMHLQDKRLFNFGDSLYHYLEQAEGYALEVDMQEFLDSVVQRTIDQKEDELIDNRRFAHAGEKKKVIDSLVKNVKERNDKNSRKQLEKMRREKLKQALKNKEMPTIMDAYLYGIARRQGKWLGGIEDVQDQLPLLDELGGDFTSEELLAPDGMVAASLENMIRLYLSEDLDAIEKFITRANSDDRENLQLLKRNNKMARRMDSLANVRSMFFTVGAAHLPGDSGVISLLRRRGFRVDPVFSSSKVDPVKYASRLSNIPWVKTEDEKGSYEVEMPGKASELSMFSNLIKMKFYADITTLTYFMAGSTFASPDVDLDKILEGLSRNVNGTFLGQKKIEINGAKGIESFMQSGGYYYKVRYLFAHNRVYMLMAGGEEKEKTETADVEKFFRSFVAKKGQEPEAPKEWSLFSNQEKAFTVLFPGVPERMEKMEKKAEGSNWAFTIYQYADQSTGSYYMLQVRDIAPGYYIPVDSVYFSEFLETLNQVIDKVTRDEKATVQSFPAFRYEGEPAQGGVLYKTLTITRGNRVYNLFAGGPKGADTEAGMDNFLHSFTMTPYPATSWQQQWSPERNFYTKAPAGLVPWVSKKEETEVEPDDQGAKYISYDSSTSTSYQVFKTAISPYYWYSSDSVFFERQGAEYKGWTDSVISKKTVYNGGLRGMEWVIETPGQNNLKKVRQLLNGDTMYTLLSFIPSQYIDEKNLGQFFDDFRVVPEDRHFTLFTSKADRLLTDLQAADSVTFTKASDAFSASLFNTEDRPLLYQALLKEYIDDTTNIYYTSRDKILNALLKMTDSSTIRFVQEQYPLQSGKKERLKLVLLNLLAGYKTADSYAALKELLLHDIPAEKGNTELSYHFRDSLVLTRSLFPEILVLSNNPVFAERIIDISAELLDSNLISRDMLLPYRENFLHTADTTLASLKKKPADEYSGDTYWWLLHLLQNFNDTAANRLLQQYLTLDEQTMKQEAALLLLKNKQPVNPKEIEKIAADKVYRRDLYDNLVKIGKQNLFPARYLTQQYLAESDMYIYASDEDEPEEVSFIGKREVIYKGEKKRFYLFRLKYEYGEEDETEQYLGIAGPYSMDLKKFEMDYEATGLFYKEQFDAKKTDQQFTAFLKMLEEEEE